MPRNAIPWVAPTLGNMAAMVASCCKLQASRVTVQSQLPALLGIKLAHQRVRDLALLGTFILRAVHSGSFPGSGQFTACQGASFQVGLIFQPRQEAFFVHTLTLVILRVDISKCSDQDSASEMLSTIFCSKPGCSKPKTPMAEREKVIDYTNDTWLWINTYTYHF